jgi:site-specific DNA recombinase
MIAEYERAKILERSRRGKRHAAQVGQVSVLSCAPYGYRYVSKWEATGEARFEILLEEARVVRQIFVWVGRDRWSIGEVQRRLNEAREQTRTGKTVWDRATIWGILKNPAYKGQAAFGKTREEPLRPRLRAQRGRNLQPKRASSTQDVAPDKWLHIAVPPLVEEALFETVQEQLQENRQRARVSQRGARYLLQGLIVWARYAGMLSMASRSVRARANAMSAPMRITAALARMRIALEECGCAGTSSYAPTWSMKRCGKKCVGSSSTRSGWRRSISDGWCKTARQKISPVWKRAWDDYDRVWHG